MAVSKNLRDVRTRFGVGSNLDACDARYARAGMSGGCWPLWALQGALLQKCRACSYRCSLVCAARRRWVWKALGRFW